ncbi:fumarate reductase subunit FrdD [Iodobacter sp. LRB]|uniref:fumarate reductase subunit FrdD n=1 Tax=unclassified Iodobacter TaxID=235634 RepID=UPI000C0C788B|nr:fumarate reductase subunit FrdD [Iodobacter sp. BJB302]PHV00207.1 fumarate reductase subunit FrdD [Iodobacter sp. BJB302]
MKANLKRSNEPIFWLLFGAGGMLAALIGAMLVLITSFATPLGLLPAGLFSYANMQGFARHLVGKALILAVIALFLWHAVHRVFHSLHDVGIHAGPVARLLCYGIAFVGSAVTLWAILAIGF